MTSVLPRKRWPAVRYGAKRAITEAEHQKIIAREQNAEARAFYQLCWHLGGAQSDVANLKAEDVDRKQQTISYFRGNTGVPVNIRFGRQLADILQDLPATGPLLPRIAAMHEKHRAKEFKRRCLSVQISGVTLHSYRYAWAERAKRVGISERHAMEMLGHNSKAVHRAYAKRAQLLVLSLEECEGLRRKVG